MVSDVEVGAFLSGGIDSTAIVSLMRQIGHDKIKTISVTFPGFVHDEAEYSNIAAQKFGTDHHDTGYRSMRLLMTLIELLKLWTSQPLTALTLTLFPKLLKNSG